MAETSFIIENGRRLNLKDAAARKSIDELRQKIGEGGGGGGTSFTTDESLLFENGVLSVNMDAVIAALPTYNGAVEDA